jgi:hypothetical protein
LRLKPIFDTNIFGHVQSGLIPQSDWQFLLRRQERYGWRLSMITALELLAGIHEIPSDRFPQLRRRVELAFALSKGRILEEPVPLLCKEVLHLPFPLTAPAEKVIRLHLDIVRHASTLQQILEGRVPFKGGPTGFKTTSAIDQVVSGPKKEWIEALEQIATDKYPAWRELFHRQGRRLPPEMCRELESPSALAAQKRSLTEYFLRWLGASSEAAAVDFAVNKLDASLEFSNFVLREFLTSNYSVEKHASDVYDQFQLRYLAVDRFIIVTDDSDLTKRTVRSSQADRILTFEQFLRTL